MRLVCEAREVRRADQAASECGLWVYATFPAPLTGGRHQTPSPSLAAPPAQHTPGRGHTRSPSKNHFPNTYLTISTPVACYKWPTFTPRVSMGTSTIDCCLWGGADGSVLPLKCTPVQCRATQSGSNKVRAPHWWIVNPNCAQTPRQAPTKL
jgi:hypothetical protein